MELFRIARARFADDLTGEGARLAGGRWNSIGTAVLYTAETRALAALEYLVHASLRAAPGDLRLLSLQVPNDIKAEEIDRDSLPSDWKTHPPPLVLAAIGTEWLSSNRSLLLRVPSVVVEQEHNVLLNPAHPDFGPVRVSPSEPFTLDGRLLR